MGQSNKETRSPDHVELDDLRVARGKAMNLTPAVASTKEVLALSQKIADVVHGGEKHVVLLALLTTYFMVVVKDEEVEMSKLLWFVEEGTFQLGSMVQALKEQGEQGQSTHKH